MQDGVFLKEHTYNDIVFQKYKDYSCKIIAQESLIKTQFWQKRVQQVKHV